MMRRVVCLLALAAIGVTRCAAADPRFACGGELEQRAWAGWQARIRPYLQKELLENRLGGTGDVYALYDFQGLTQDLVEMARRCGRKERLRDIAGVARQAYGMLTDGGPFSAGPRWLCRGGPGCGRPGRPARQEIVLCSVQFLGLATALAGALADAGPEPEDLPFIEDTLRIALGHLRRWDNALSRSRLRRVLTVRREDIASDSSLYLFTDTDLWQIAVYAELAGLLRHPWLAADAFGAGERARAHGHLSALLAFFQARLSRIPPTGRADLDRGYWARLRSNRYAGYAGEAAPVACVATGAAGPARPWVRIPAEAVVPAARLGWDISHARRFVPAVAAIERNRAAMAGVFGIDASRLPPRDLGPALAATLTGVVWNGDRDWPLFANFWSGDNGWYRVAWDDGSGKCREGYPPYGLSDAFPTGGYPAWARYRPVIGELGRRLYRLVEAPDSQSRDFLKRYYPALAGSQGAPARERAILVFLASLIGTGA